MPLAVRPLLSAMQRLGPLVRVLQIIIVLEARDRIVQNGTNRAVVRVRLPIRFNEIGENVSPRLYR